MLKILLTEIRKNKGKKKDPISLLMELGQIAQKNPTFEFGTDACFPGVYTCKASFLYLEKEGREKSKQESKRSACVQILKGIMYDLDEDLQPYCGGLFQNSDIVLPRATPTEEIIHTPPGENYVGQLQEYAQRLGIPIPVYQELREQGPAHNKQFSVEVELSSKGLKTVGTGASKKVAKRNAASKLLQQLERMSTPNSRASQNHTVRNLNQDFASALAVSPSGRSKMETDIGPSSAEHNLRSMDSFSEKPDTSPFKIQKEAPADRFLSVGANKVTSAVAVTVLLQWGGRNGYKISHHAVESNNPFMKLMFVKVHCDPPVVCSGQGSTTELAHADAAFNVLLQLDSLGQLGR